ncbi:hypothetical protein M2352_000259 [Azospirillum fermentarium]|uniref:DUF3306 domain-containing protein n=1 Tax=Azospirillum fermentarium TaxID=1233114 RepID=UPI0022277847|nr:DUF3306 domain-containing protein [Azospirillum fermentarium]MCW2244668.1 hypothetical protein [Azospirillum fermentarium]
MSETRGTPEPFLSRWSRLKRTGETTATAPEPAPEPPAPLPEPDAAAQAPTAPQETAPPPELPPVDSLTAESDFTPFLRAEVPEDLHRQALRRLWTSDPVYANDDGLKDYADDYSGLFSGSGAVRTLYRAGQGFLDAVDEAAEQAEKDAQKLQEAAENTEEPPPTDMRDNA